MVVSSVDAVVITPVYECSPSSPWSSLMLSFWSHIDETYPLGVFGLICVWEPLLSGRKEFFLKKKNKPHTQWTWKKAKEASFGVGEESLIWWGYEKQLWIGRWGLVKFASNSRKSSSLKIWCTYSFSAWVPEADKEIQDKKCLSLLPCVSERFRFVNYNKKMHLLIDWKTPAINNAWLEWLRLEWEYRLCGSKRKNIGMRSK